MHITKGMGNNKKIILLGVLLLAGCLTACGKKESGEKKEFMTEEEIKEAFKHEDEMFEETVGLGNYDGLGSFYIKELEQQIEEYWDYYEKHEKAQQELDKVIAEWEADFLTEGVYVVGENVPAGYYIFCNPKGNYNDDNNCYTTNVSTVPEREGSVGISPHFEVEVFEDGDKFRVTGAPKMASADLFPAFQSAEDGNYYEGFYRVGTDIPEGSYFVLSMDVENGTYEFYTKRQCNDNFTPWGNHTGIGSRFTYISLKPEDEYIEIKNCVLIPIRQKPEILPVYHINIGEYQEKRTEFDRLLSAKYGIRWSNYEQPVYAEGDYIIGEDIPLGKYKIEEEVTWDGGVSYKKSGHPKLIRDSYYEKSFAWSGVCIIDEDDIEQCGWRSVRMSRGKVEITDAEGNKEYKELAENSAQTVTFKEKDKGCVVRLTRALLVPEE